MQLSLSRDAPTGTALTVVVVSNDWNPPALHVGKLVQQIRSEKRCGFVLRGISLQRLTFMSSTKIF